MGIRSEAIEVPFEVVRSPRVAKIIRERTERTTTPKSGMLTLGS